MRNSIIVVLLSFFIQNTYAQQKQAAWWYSGSRKIDFGSGKPKDYPIQRGGRVLNACASISDKNGNLLLWCDGFSILNSRNRFLKNGYDIYNTRNNVTTNSSYDSLTVSSSSGGNIKKSGFCEFPGNPSKFFFFWLPAIPAGNT